MWGNDKNPPVSTVAGCKNPFAATCVRARRQLQGSGVSESNLRAGRGAGHQSIGAFGWRPLIWSFDANIMVGRVGSEASGSELWNGFFSAGESGREFLVGSFGSEALGREFLAGSFGPGALGRELWAGSFGPGALGWDIYGGPMFFYTHRGFPHRGNIPHTVAHRGGV